MHPDILAYHEKQTPEDTKICERLFEIISSELPEAEYKIWHAHPVWFLEGNPIVGYSKEKPGIRLMFWSGKDFEEAGLNTVGKKFKDASIFYTNVTQIQQKDLIRWLKMGRKIQWDYKNIVKNKGKLSRIK